MPGYDRSRIVGVSEEDLEEFICGICLDVLIKPTLTQCCEQTYCYDCIKEWLTVNNNCPNDRKDLSLDQLKIPPRLVLNLLGNLRIKCDFHESGCQYILKINDLDKHRNHHCEYNPNIKCEKCGLGQLNHTDKMCIDALCDKVNYLSIKIENNKKQHDELIKKERIEADSRLCAAMSKVESLENKIEQLQKYNDDLSLKVKQTSQSISPISSDTQETGQNPRQGRGWGRRSEQAWKMRLERRHGIGRRLSPEHEQVIDQRRGLGFKLRLGRGHGPGWIPEHVSEEKPRFQIVPELNLAQRSELKSSAEHYDNGQGFYTNSFSTDI